MHTAPGTSSFILPSCPSLLLVLSALLIAGCASDRLFIRSLETQQHSPDPDFRVRYLGTGCFLMDYRGNTLLTDPFVSNPGAVRSIAGKVSTDTAYVDRHVAPSDLGSVKLVASGHSHYDHLMDLPYLCRHMPGDAKLCVNRTGKHILASYGLPHPVVIMDSLRGDSVSVGQWAYAVDSTVRVMPIASLHPPQFMGIHLMRGRVTEDLTEPPTRIYDWLQGRTHAFLIDFMENGTPARRVYFSSSMAPAPFGLFPEHILEEKCVDAVFLGAAGDYDAERYPRPILELAEPSRVYLIHWESFFRSKDRKAKAISRRGLRKFYEETVETVGKDVPVVVTFPLREY